MREIKFRAWDKNGTFNQKIPCMHEDITGNTIFDYIWHDDDLPKMQYTGLKDKNGKEIYEGDILSVDYFSNVNPSDYDDNDYFDDTPRIKVVEWKEFGYSIEKHKSLVIGNIYENPELLK